MQINWVHLVAIIIIAAAQASFAMNIARMKVFRTLRQKVLYWAAKSEEKRRIVAKRFLFDLSRIKGEESISRFEYKHAFHGMSWERFFYELLACPYCFGHYVALILVFIYQPRPLETDWWVLDLAISVFLIVTVSALFAGLIHRALDPMPAYVDMDDPDFFQPIDINKIIAKEN